jgi:hypothetical protein
MEKDRVHNIALLDSCPIAKLPKCPMRLRSQWIILVSGHKPTVVLTMAELE